MPAIFSLSSLAPYTMQAAKEQQAAEAPMTTSADHPDWFGRVAKTLYAAGLGLDVGTTAKALGSGDFREQNPIYNAAGTKGVFPIWLGTEVAALALGHHVLAKDHPKIWNAYLAAFGGAHLAGGIHNLNALASYKDQTIHVMGPGR